MQKQSFRFILLLTLLTAACGRASDTPYQPTEYPELIIIPTKVETVDQLNTPSPFVLEPTVSSPSTGSNEPSSIQPQPTPIAISASAEIELPVEPCTPFNNWSQYTVQAGDTLFQIAEQSNSSVDEIKAANCLTTNTLFINQEIVVPHPPTPDPASFAIDLTINPILQHEPTIDSFLLETGQSVTLQWIPSGDWPTGATQGNQLEFGFQPMNGPAESLMTLQNIPNEPVSFQWVVPDNRIGSIFAHFRWAGNESYFITRYQTVVTAAVEDCLFAPHGSGGGAGILQTPEINSPVVGGAPAGEVLFVHGYSGEWSTPQSNQSGVFYQVTFTTARAWVQSNQGLLFGTGCNTLSELSGHETTAEPCSRRWFYAPNEPAYGRPCPLEAQETWAAAQSFERGTMFWLEEIGRYYVLADVPLSGATQHIHYPLLTTTDPLNITADSSASFTAPEGLLAPESGFGYLWRNDTAANLGDLSSRLGWAIAPEVGFMTSIQCDDAIPTGGRSWQSCYFAAPDGSIIHILPASYEHWRLN